MPGGVYQRGNIWWAWWTEPVKEQGTGRVRQRKRYASSKSARRADAVTLLSTKMHEARLRKPRPDLPDPTYDECRDLWLEHRAAEHRAKGTPVPKLKNGAQYFQGRKYLDEAFSGWQARSIDAADLERLRARLAEAGLRNGANHVFRSLRAMLRWAVECGRLRPEHLPARFPMTKARRRQPVPIPEESYGPLLRALPEPWRTGFALAYHMGIRLSEIERLERGHVDPKRRLIHFPGAKEGDWRPVPLLGGTDALLAELLAKHGRERDLLLPGFSDRTARARAWREAAVAVGMGRWVCRRCGEGLEKMGCAEHGALDERTAKYEGPLMRWTRHTAIRNMTNAGVPLQRVMQVTGHRNVPTHLAYNVPAESDLEMVRRLYDGKKKR